MHGIAASFDTLGPVSDLTLGLCLNAIDEVLLALLDTTEDSQHA